MRSKSHCRAHGVYASALAAVLACLFVRSVTAALPPPTTDGSLTAGGEAALDSQNRAVTAGSGSSYTGLGTDNLSYLGVGNIAAGGNASVGRNMVLGPTPQLNISASAAVTSVVSPSVLPQSNIGLGSYVGLGFVRLQYPIEITGPAGPVNLVVQGTIGASGSGQTSSSGGGGSAHFAINLGGTSVLFDQVALDANGEHLTHVWVDAAGVTHNANDANYAFTSFVENGVFTIQANTIYTVDLAASASASATAGYDVFSTAASGNAFADPYFAIDPSTPNAGAYTLLISPGVGNAAPAPEPATLALLAFGIPAALLFRRRKAGVMVQFRVPSCAAGTGDL